MKRSWQSYVINGILRLTIKRRLPVHNSIGYMRTKFLAIDARFARRPKEATIEPIDMQGLPGERIRTAESRDDRVLLYLHGGGFVLPALGAHREMLGNWCRTLGCTVYMPDYRLAPENPYPAAPLDCLHAYRWLLAQGVEPSRIVTAGDSAGGALTLSLMHALREAGLPMPAALVMLSPASDLTMSGTSALVNEKRDPMFCMQVLLMMRQAYANELQTTEHAASPLFGPLSGLPPMMITAGSTEMMLSDSERVAVRATEAGGDARLDVWRGLPHAFPVMSLLPEARRVIDDIAAFLRERSVWAPAVPAAGED